MKRRWGTGTVEKTRDGRFRARYPVAGERTEMGIYDDAKDAHDILDGVAAERHDRGTTAGISLNKMAEKTFTRRRALGYASVDGDESRWATYFADAELGSQAVCLLTEGEVLEYVLGLRHQKTGEYLSHSTRKSILNMVRAVLAVAKEDGQVDVNALLDTSVPDPKGRAKKAKKKVKRRALTWEQFAALWTASGQSAVLAVAVWTGVRQGELRALHWADVHNVKGRKCSCDEHRSDPHIVVRYSRPPVRGLDCSPKGGEVQAVTLFGEALLALEALPESPTGIVFPSRLKGYRAKGRMIGRKLWTKWKIAAGLPTLRYHDLRHTCCTWLVRGELRMGIDAAWPLEAVKEHARHAELRTTELYADQRTGSLAQQMGARARCTQPANSPQAISQLQSRFGDLNPRPTVYESQHIASDRASLDDVAGCRRALLEAVAANSPTLAARAVDLIEAIDRAGLVGVRKAAC